MTPHMIELAITSIATIVIIIKNNLEIRKEQKKQLHKMEIVVKRIELNQAIDHDFGPEIVGELINEYYEMGGNSYMSEKAKKYFREKGVC